VPVPVLPVPDDVLTLVLPLAAVVFGTRLGTCQAMSAMMTAKIATGP
jgi:hypothetical protein